MTTVGDKDSHFLCQLKMEEQIHCAHTVKLTAPGLVIDKGGTVGTELTYSFAANDGLTAQDIGIVGHNPGEYTIFADITSPYYVSANGLKVKKDKIGITIRDSEPDGWYGDKHGVSIGNGDRQVDSGLYYKYTDVSGAGKSFSYVPLGCYGNLSTLRIIGPGTDQYIQSIQSVGRTVGIPSGYPGGVYIFRPYSNPTYGVEALANLTFSMDAASKTVKQRGIRIASGHFISKALGETFTEVFGETLDSHYPLVSFALGSFRSSDTNHPEAPTFNGNVTYGSNGFTATGSWQWGIFNGQWTPWGYLAANCTATYDGQTLYMESALSRG